MQHRPAWAPDEIDIERPSVARMYDYFLGGSHNFAADRELAEQARGVFPDAPHVVRANRAFLYRVVVELCALGITQFLDLGSGIPTAGNVHEVAAEANPGARTLYVDADAVAIAHANAILQDEPNVRVLHADLRDPKTVLEYAAGPGGLDLSLPVGVLIVSVLPFVPDEDQPAALVGAFRDATVPGSYLALSHGTNDYMPETMDKIEGVYSNASQPGVFRSRSQVSKFFAGYELLEPGLVDAIHWRPAADDQDSDPLGGDVARYGLLGGVGRRI